MKDFSEKAMKDDNIVTINGQKYDKDTGLPVEKLTPKLTKASGDVKTVHKITAKPKALYSHASLKTFNDITSPRHKIGRNMDIAKSKQISRFAPNTKPEKSTQTSKQHDIKPISHPIAAKVEKKRSHSKNIPATSSSEKTSKIIKQEAIAEALTKPSKPSNPKINFLSRNKKYFNIFTISAVVLIIAGYLIYLNMPGISVRVASIQAGINATYPEYHPDGYSLSGPVSYSDGEVTINFHANTGSSEFVIKQSKSSWDSSALKIQVDKDSNNETSESQESGLTIYTYEDNTKARWVNGGILYSITGDAKLSGDQIRRIATSL